MNDVSESLFEPYADAVYAWAYRLIGRHHDALDVVQEVFLRWARQCDSRPPDRPRGWLRRVTVNQAIDWLRGRRSVAQADASALPAPGGRPALDVADRELLRHDVAAALDELTESQRSVLVAKVFDEMTFGEIAAEQGLAVSTVKTHYVRAVEALRRRLRSRWADEG